MIRDLDENGRPYKCGPNWLPNWVYDEPFFYECCRQHDISWTERSGKFSADLALFRCCWRKSDEDWGWWRVRSKIQSVLMFFILTTNPFSYLYYYLSNKKK